ncbi:AraC-type DNA-binding protein [Flagellimonas taeanensis]|jgi:AraC-like DNA-binding protein|uniref:AraC-type DNA-binding protein n=1 Tax=Flagellimonas taeanensis TaxID=1005926 RepID=A0A1M6WCR7_9FLAO|nr:AraC family transcriptional regulator [Allomuricauda taeanensis]MEE1963635.1 AraC family transcriptional regulator [Allomuricauda taeanensis]SFC44550.1 AraC-type DNA-binding protein [Allomuricauda taeanensis]SHK91285.1 transcriptional regulator, AraC family [Allomuricauda taeanensis]
MKLHLLNRKSDASSSFSVTQNSYPYFLKVWHYHPELELVFIKKSTGTRFIGDSIQKFQPGEVVLLGKNLPHMWLNDDHYFEAEDPNAAEAVAIHFTEDFLGEAFFKSVELSHIGLMLETAIRGIKFQSTGTDIQKYFENMPVMDSFSKTIALIELLNKLTKHKNHEFLSSIGYMDNFEQNENKKLRKVYGYIFDNFKNEVNLGEVAQLIGMNPSAFSRFFKRTHRKTFTRYLNEVRIGYACKLLLENENNITGTAYESGFNNISNFNRQFRTIKKMSPKDYIKSYKKSE